MALKAVVTSLDGVDAQFHSLYSKDEESDNYVLEVEGVDEMPAVVGLRKKRDELLGKLKTASESLKQFDGIDLEKYSETMSKIEKGELVPKGSADPNADIAKLTEEYEAKIQGIQSKAESELKQLQEKVGEAEQAAEREKAAARAYFTQKEITSALAEHDVPYELLGHIVERQVKVETTDDGRFQLHVVGADGHPRVKDSKGNHYQVADLVEEMREDPKYQRAFPSSGASGSGAQGGGSRTKNGTVSRSQPGAFIQNMEGIANGDVTLTD